MRRIFSFAASAAFLLGLFSCQEKEGALPPPESGDILKTVSVTLGDPATRAASALSGEGAVEDATLFVWQHNAETDETTLYQKAYAEASAFEFNLLFSDQTEYTYSINAWANMGELDAEPADGEVLFSNEEATGLQMKGSKSGIDQASASAVTIDMKRFVGKITVAEVALEWTNEQNALQDFTLKSIYVADAGDKAEGAVATYNVGGAYVSSAMDALLYSPVNSVIADGAKYEIAQMMYAYGSGSTSIVLECDLGGQTMYYHVPYEPEWNTHRVFRFTVRQAGADSPLGELPEEAIEVSVTTLNVLDWDADEQENDFGEEPAASSIPYLTFSAAGEQDVTLLAMAVNGGESSFIPEGMEYSVGGGEWTAAVLNTPVSFGGTKGDLRFRAKSSIGTSTLSGDLSKDLSGEAMGFSFGSDEPVSCSGDIRTLVDWENYETASTADARFAVLFGNCTSLISAPDLPATELADLCYCAMFGSCTSLTEAPELPATELAYGCYNLMFKDCTSLSYIKMLATDISASECLTNWVSGVSATGTFVKSADATWDVTGESGVPFGWNVETDLTIDSAEPGIRFDAYVYDVNGNFYTASEWTASGNDNSTAVGVAVTDGEHSFVIHPTESKLMWSSNSSVLVDGVFTTEDRATAQTDFAGEANTAAILAAVSAGTIADAPAASYCDGVEFAHGKKGYLPAAGEITLCYTCLTTINECMSAIGGTAFDIAGKLYWTSTQCSVNAAWSWTYGSKYVSSNSKYVTGTYVRAVSAL